MQDKSQRSSVHIVPIVNNNGLHTEKIVKRVDLKLNVLTTVKRKNEIFIENSVRSIRGPREGYQQGPLFCAHISLFQTNGVICLNSSALSTPGSVIHQHLSLCSISKTVMYISWFSSLFPSLNNLSIFYTYSKNQEKVNGGDILKSQGCLVPTNQKTKNKKPFLSGNFWI